MLCTSPGRSTSVRSLACGSLMSTTTCSIKRHMTSMRIRALELKWRPNGRTLESRLTPPHTVSSVNLMSKDSGLGRGSSPRKAIGSSSADPMEAQARGNRAGARLRPSRHPRSFVLVHALSSLSIPCCARAACKALLCAGHHSAILARCRPTWVQDGELCPAQVLLDLCLVCDDAAKGHLPAFTNPV